MLSERILESQSQLQEPEAMEILIVDPSEARSRSTIDSLKALVQVRYMAEPHGRAALDSFSRFRFDAIVCRPDMGDMGWRRL